jgi:hypothetical protein
MLANVGVWVGVSIVAIIWVLMALVVVAAVVVGGRAERRLREEVPSRGSATSRAQTWRLGRTHQTDSTTPQAIVPATEPGARRGRLPEKNSYRKKVKGMGSS